MKKFTADVIVPVSGTPLTKAVVICDDYGRILDIVQNISDFSDVQFMKGVMIPGFINAHCHLELSHLKGKFNTGTGLITFIGNVVSQRDFPKDYVQDAIRDADQEMFECGIVAVGDICNRKDTWETKKKSKLKYFSFIEMFDFLQDDNADKVFDQYKEVYDSYNVHGRDKKSLVPHSPYTVSARLFDIVNRENMPGSVISIHNQETMAENDLFQDRSGELLQFYKNFGIDLTSFQPIGKSSIHYSLKNLSPDLKVLMVHNTLTTEADIQHSRKWGGKIYWVTCPNANLFIENRLPDYDVFKRNHASMCIGTDSLSSNWQLSILEEIKTIKKYQSNVTDLELIQWSTLNGAEALDMQEELGSIEVGKTPGLNVIDVEVENGQFDLRRAKRVQRLI